MWFYFSWCKTADTWISVVCFHILKRRAALWCQQSVSFWPEALTRLQQHLKQEVVKISSVSAATQIYSTSCPGPLLTRCCSRSECSRVFKTLPGRPAEEVKRGSTFAATWSQNNLRMFANWLFCCCSERWSGPVTDLQLVPVPSGAFPDGSGNKPSGHQVVFTCW